MDGVEDLTQRFHIRKAKRSRTHRKRIKKEMALMKHGEDGRSPVHKHNTHTRRQTRGRTDARRGKPPEALTDLRFFMSCQGFTFFSDLSAFAIVNSLCFLLSFPLLPPSSGVFVLLLTRERVCEREERLETLFEGTATASTM